ncbi:hypothetical protein M758_1G168200 [Ceratodon purpureus]|nr:hypothetical protein M758_1G168200 [Ceratodon purpureus]
MHIFAVPVVPSLCAIEGLASTSSVSDVARLKGWPGENALADSLSRFSLRGFEHAVVGVRVRVAGKVVGGLEGEGEDQGWFRERAGGRGRGRGGFRGGGSNGGRGGGRGRGRGASSREDTRGDSKFGEQGERRWRHPREGQWPPPNPRRVYPSNLRYAPNPVYPKKNPFYPKTEYVNSRNDVDQIATRVQDQDGVRNGDSLPSSSREEPEKETYLRQLLNARSINPKPSKSHILEAEDLKEDEASISSQPYATKRSPSSEAVAVTTNMSADEKALRQALKQRREQTREVLREHFKEAQLSRTFSQLVVENMPAFVDHILIQAVALKSQERYVTSTFVARARACLAQTKVAALVKWMKHNHITYPRIGKLVDLKGTDLDRLRERIHFLKKNYVRGRDLGVVLTRHPVILERPLDELCNLIQLLEDAGVRRDWVGFVICRSPGVLALSIDELLDKISFFQELGVKPEYLGPMAFNFPASIGRFPLSEMQAKVEFLRRLGLVDASIGKAIAQRPQLLACDIENGWQRLVKYFKFLGIQDAGIQRIFHVHPSVFCMNLEKNIAPKVRFFRAIGIREDAIGQVIVDFPALMSYSMDRKIRPVVRFILEEAGVKEEHIGKVIALRPQLIGTGLTLRLKPLVQYLRNQQLRREEIGRMVADFPMLLRYNLVVIESKLKFFKRHMKRPVEDLISFPR